MHMSRRNGCVPHRSLLLIKKRLLTIKFLGYCALSSNLIEWVGRHPPDRNQVTKRRHSGAFYTRICTQASLIATLSLPPHDWFSDCPISSAEG